MFSSSVGDQGGLGSRCTPPLGLNLAEVVSYERSLAVVLVIRRTPVMHGSDHHGATTRVKQQSASCRPFCCMT